MERNNMDILKTKEKWDYYRNLEEEKIPEKRKEIYRTMGITSNIDCPDTEEEWELYKEMRRRYDFPFYHATSDGKLEIVAISWT